MLVVGVWCLVAEGPNYQIQRAFSSLKIFRGSFAEVDTFDEQINCWRQV